MNQQPKNARALVIAEVANTHNGSPERMANLVRFAAEAKADAIKFQYFKAEDLVGPDHPEYDIFKQLEMTQADWLALFQQAHGLGLSIYSDVFGLEGIPFLLEIGCDGFKIHSSDIGNRPLLERIGGTGLPILLSLSGATPRDAWHAIRALRAAGCSNITLMLGFQAFPTAVEDLKVGLIPWYMREFDLPVGYADHVAGDSPMALIVPQLALAQGATIIEKHFTYDRAAKPEDYEAAIEPEQFAEMVAAIRQSEIAIGGSELKLTEAEKLYSLRMKKFPLAAHALAPGVALQAADVTMLRLGANPEMFPAEFEDMLGRVVKVAIPANDPIRYSALEWKVALLVTVRSRSTRLPGKAFADIAGKPSIAWLLERLKQVQYPAEIVVCTTTLPEDDVLVALAEKMGVRTFRGPTQDVLARLIGAADMVGADIVVRITGDDILSDPVYIDRCLAWHLDHNAEYTVAEGLPYGVDREVIATKVLKWVHELAYDKEGTEYLSWYLDDPAFVRGTTLVADPDHTRPHYRLSLDTPADLDLLRAIFAKLAPAGQAFTLEDVIALLDANPELLKINQTVRPKLAREAIDTRLRLAPAAR
jgi:N,N'-diacetyllegionaminate synthase